MEPITLPEPAIVSRTGIIEVVAACAAFRWEAMRAMAAGRGDGPVEPGLQDEHGKVGVSGSVLSSFCSTLVRGRNAEETVKGDSRVKNGCREGTWVNYWKL